MGILIPRGVQHLEEEDLSSIREMDVRYSLPKWFVLSVAVLTVESAKKAVMPVSVAIGVGIWLETAHKMEVGLE